MAKNRNARRHTRQEAANKGQTQLNTNEDLLTEGKKEQQFNCHMEPSYGGSASTYNCGRFVCADMETHYRIREAHLLRVHAVLAEDIKEVINKGVSGASKRRILSMLSKIILSYEPQPPYLCTCEYEHEGMMLEENNSAGAS